MGGWKCGVRVVEGPSGYPVWCGVGMGGRKEFVALVAKEHTLAGYQKTCFGQPMNIDGFISMPSFRPDGRLERLNFGGGSDREKQQRMVDLFTEMKARENAQKAKAAKNGQAQQQHQQGQARQPRHSSGGSRVVAGASAGGAMYAQGGQAASPQAASPSAAAAPKRRRTLLSGGGKSLSQPYGNETILGA